MLSEPLLALWSLSVVLATTLAMAKRRNLFGWLALALLTGPLALILLLPLADVGGSVLLAPETMELCDSCAEVVRRDRSACRHCGAGRPI